MTRVLSITGWTLRVLALVWMISIVLSVATAAEGFTNAFALLPGVAFHAVCAVAGVQLVAAAKRKSSAAATAEATA